MGLRGQCADTIHTRLAIRPRSEAAASSNGTATADDIETTLLSQYRFQQEENPIENRNQKIPFTWKS